VRVAANAALCSAATWRREAACCLAKGPRTALNGWLRHESWLEGERCERATLGLQLCQSQSSFGLRSVLHTGCVEAQVATLALLRSSWAALGQIIRENDVSVGHGGLVNAAMLMPDVIALAKRVSTDSAAREKALLLLADCAVNGSAQVKTFPFVQGHWALKPTKLTMRW